MWIGYAACGWALLFAVMSFYWVAGGKIGIHTIAAKVEEIALANDPVVVFVTGVLKVLLALLALALAQSWGTIIPRWLLLLAGWGAGIFLLLYGGANLVDHGLMVTGAIDTPSVLGHRAARWHLFFWDPWWLLGGILFTVTTWRFQRRSAHLP
jgi:hypothetical protein